MTQRTNKRERTARPRKDPGIAACVARHNETERDPGAWMRSFSQALADALVEAAEKEENTDGR